MALIECAECHTQISGKATSCPNCRAPVATSAPPLIAPASPIATAAPIAAGAADVEKPASMRVHSSAGNPLAWPFATRWPRFFARIFDVWWEVLLVGLVVGFALGYYFPGLADWINGPVASPLFGIACLPIALVLDALIYQFAGNTPGKSLLGLKVGTLDGRPLSFSQYLGRNVWMWTSGLALGFPVVNLLTMARQSSRLSSGKQASYDEPYGFRVRAKPLGEARKTAFGFAFAGLFVVMVTLNGMGQTAQHRFKPSIADELLSAAKEVSRSSPKMIDAETRLDGAVAGPGLSFTYLYTFPNIESSQVDVGVFDANMVSQVKKAACPSSALKPLFDRNVIVHYEYRGKDGSRIGTVTLDRKICDLD